MCIERVQALDAKPLRRNPIDETSLCHGRAEREIDSSQENERELQRKPKSRNRGIWEAAQEDSKCNIRLISYSISEKYAIIVAISTAFQGPFLGLRAAKHALSENADGLLHGVSLAVKLGYDELFTSLQ